MQATLDVTPGGTYQIRVGGQNGYNGGGAAGSDSARVGNGGGASDMRSGAFGLDDRLLVAGGGAYNAISGSRGGSAGHPHDQAGASYGSTDGGGGGGTQSGGGAGEYGAGDGLKGQGGAGGINTNGGGGGYYGGGGYGAEHEDDFGAGGGGGSSDGPAGASFQTAVYYKGVYHPNGKVVLSYTLVDTTAPVIAHTINGVSGSNSWYVSQVTVGFTCTNEAGGSGIATNAVAGATLSNDGAGQSVTNSGAHQPTASHTVCPQHEFRSAVVAIRSEDSVACFSSSPS